MSIPTMTYLAVGSHFHEALGRYIAEKEEHHDQRELFAIVTRGYSTSGIMVYVDQRTR